MSGFVVVVDVGVGVGAAVFIVGHDQHNCKSRQCVKTTIQLAQLSHTHAHYCLSARAAFL